MAGTLFTSFLLLAVALYLYLYSSSRAQQNVRLPHVRLDRTIEDAHLNAGHHRIP